MKQPNDSLRKIVRDKILSHTSMELSIIKGKHLWIDDEITDDSLSTIKRDAQMKYAFSDFPLKSGK